MAISRLLANPGACWGLGVEESAAGWSVETPVQLGDDRPAVLSNDEGVAVGELENVVGWRSGMSSPEMPRPGCQVVMSASST